MVEITADLVLKAYAAGIFPMSEARDDPRVFWVDPEHRGIIPLNEFHLSLYQNNQSHGLIVGKGISIPVSR